MNLTLSHLDQLISWVTTSREFSTKLEYQADSLLVSLQRIKARAMRLEKLKHQPLTIGLYGHAQAGKNALLTALQRSPDCSIEIQLGEQSLDYLTHINPGHVPPAIGVRFTQRADVASPQYPVRLALFSETELTGQFMLRYQREMPSRPLPISVVAARLDVLETRRVPDAAGPGSVEEIALLLLEYRRSQRRDARLDPAIEMRISSLAPELGLNDRAALFSLLWGEDSHLTQEWLQLAQLLEQLGHPEYVLAPASLLIDKFMLPAEGFLTPVSPHCARQTDDVLVCPWVNGLALPALSVGRQQLTQVCAEVTLTQKPGATHTDVDLLDIPLGQLAAYTRRLQPDLLLICNAVDHVRDIQATSITLKDWVQGTQVSGNDNVPGLIWAITSADSRFTNGIHLDEGVQQRVGLARVHWGTLQAQDSRNMHLLCDWLQGTVTPERQRQRLTLLNSALKKQVRDLFRGLTGGQQRTPEQEKQQAEQLVRALQTHVLQLGTLLADLVPSREALKQCWLLAQQQASAISHDQGLNINLFADDSPAEETRDEGLSYARAVHRLWINHLHARLQQSEGYPALAIAPEHWHDLGEILIVASYRLGLEERLEGVTNEHQQELAIARAHSALGDFVAWLGYEHTPHDQRPLSRINKQQPLFAPAGPQDIHQRLQKLGEQPQHTNARYPYDWLVALYTRAIENQGYHLPHQQDDQQHQALLRLLA